MFRVGGRTGCAKLRVNRCGTPRWRHACCLTVCEVMHWRGAKVLSFGARSLNAKAEINHFSAQSRNWPGQRLVQLPAAAAASVKKPKAACCWVPTDSRCHDSYSFCCC